MGGSKIDSTTRVLDKSGNPFLAFMPSETTPAVYSSAAI